MYSSSYLTMRRWGKNEVSGEHKAVLELASAMQKQLQQELERGDATDVQTMSEHQIRRRIAKDLNGGSILLKSTTLLGSEHKVESNISEHEIYPFSFKDWMKGEKWWLIFLFLSMTAMWVCVFFAPTWVIFLLLPFAVLFAMYVSESSKNRGVIVFWLVLVLGVVPTMIIRLYLLPGYQRYV
ncbi:hypothetical protein GQ44DRAFT_606115 [Phaeosphaeriaceae sp. PMI808]|nr:hypothetical protein GQ44DRAFT_606115 [Phaeosphaeriaceae sp. PMI808]